MLSLPLAARSRALLRGVLALTLCAVPVLVTLAHAQGGQTYTVEPIPDALWARMAGVSWHENLPCPARDDLALVTVTHLDYEGKQAEGRIVVAAEKAEGIGRVFERLLAEGVRFARIEPVSEHGGDDNVSMAANNTSAFNCRTVSGTDRLSSHAMGLAIDVNPIENPWVKGRRTSPEEGRPFDTPAEREAAADAGHPGIALPGGPIVRAFAEEGWQWGGNWQNSKDYQHFSTTGR